MREVAERRQQLELEHEQALAILKFKQDEIKRLQRVRATTSHTLTMFRRNIFLLHSPLVALSLTMGRWACHPAGGNLWAHMKL